MIKDYILKILGIIFVLGAILIIFNSCKNNNESTNSFSKPIEAVYITDNNYVTFMRTSIRSMIANKNPKTKITIYVIGSNLSDENIKKIQKEQRKNIEIKIIPIEQELISNLGGGTDINPNVSRADNSKFFLASLLKNSDKVLYLDGDTLILKDLSDLYSTELSNNYVGAADDWQTGWDNNPEKRYFNNGVMLLNLREMRKNNIEEKLINFKKNDTIKRFVTQDAFNTVMYGKVTYLPLTYNTFAPEYDNDIFLLSKVKKTLKNNFDSKLYPYKTTDEYRKNVAIIHYCGYENQKPWYILSFRRKSNNLWYKYATPEFWLYCLKGNCRTAR